ncbi:MAG: hypothetical protein RR444_05085 [Oscillospiraceae bacterium]
MMTKLRSRTAAETAEHNRKKQEKGLMFVIESDLIKLDELFVNDIIQTCDDEILRCIYGELTVRYDPYITEFGCGLFGYDEKQRVYTNDLNKDSIIDNLKKIKIKLEIVKNVGLPKSIKQQQNLMDNTVNVNNSNTTSVEINITFNDAKNNIENMSALSPTETDEILAKIDELERIVISNENKSKKWATASAFVNWISTKGVDVAMTILPLLLRIGK